MAPRALILALLAFGLLEGIAAKADLLVPVSQTRTVSVYVQAFSSFPPDFLSDGDSDSASGFDAFTSSVSAQIVPNGQTVSANAQQSSSIGVDGVVASGSMTVDMAFVDGYGSASSSFSLTFDVLAPLDFTLAGQLTSDTFAYPFGAPTRVRLTGGPGNQTIVDILAPQSVAFPFSEEGMLLAGRYTLLADTQASPDQGSATGSYDLVFTLVPEPSTGLLLAGGLLGLAGLRPRARS